MRRFRKSAILLGAGLLALVMTIQFRGEDGSLGGHTPIRASVTPARGAVYDLSQLTIFTKTLFQVRENYFDKNRFDPKRMLVGALDFLQRDVPEILIDRSPERDPKQVTVKVNGAQKVFNIEKVEAPWSLRTTLQEILKFVQPNLQPVAPTEEAKRLVDIEMAATNGMLYTLDPHSILLDVESFKDMRMTTQGKFGGLGIVIGMDRKNRITVRKPMPSTPAMRAGLKAKDHIVRINNESTMNMTLAEAVERLRGDPGAPVDVYIDRDGVSGTKKYTIVRDVIRPPSIDPPARVMNAPAQGGQPAAKVGYVKITSFSANTDRDLQEALEMFDKERVKGVVMDLRFNPGGLYDQAQKVADAFIDSGVLVSMVGVGGSQRKDEHATRNGDTKVPVAVLVNQFSASASEIVAGAMKHLDRGVIIGETTFGKGSVQMLFDITSPVKIGSKSDDDKLGLKLTTAQYLTAGDISIQGVGVTPDIQMIPLQVQKREDEALINLQPSAHRRQESDYEWHLDNPTQTRAEKPLETVSYLFVPQPGWEKKMRDEAEESADDEQEEEPDEPDDQQKSDFLIDFARDFLAQAKTSRRRELVSQSKTFLDHVRADEDKKITQALEKLGVDWSPAPANQSAQGPASIELQLARVGGGAKVRAGDVVKIRGTVKNTGTTTVYRVRAVLQSDNGLFDENEMVFGKIAPGGSKTYDLTVHVPKSMLTRTDVIKANVYAQGALKASVAEVSVDIEGKAHPLFAYTYQTIDDLPGAGNRDGLVQRGERVRTLVRIKNIGAGTALRPQAILRNGPGQEGILISAGRFESQDLAPGATWTVSFVYEVGQEYKANEYTLEMAVADRVLGESLTDKFAIKVADAPVAVEPASGTVAVKHAEAVVLESPRADGLVVGRVKKGASFRLTGKAGGFARVELEKERPAFLRLDDVGGGGSVAVAAPDAVAPVWQVTPPVLAATAPTVVAGETVHLKGTASDDNEVRDVFIRVWNRDSKMPVKKVYYLSNRGGGDKRKLSFETDVPLWAGSNVIQVFARENNEIQSVQTLVVRRGALSLATKEAKAAPTQSR